MELQVYLKVNRNTIKTVRLSTSDEDIGKRTVRDLKNKALSHFPDVRDPDDLRLIFHGKNLKDDKKLEDYGTKELSVIQAIMRMRGGSRPGPLPPDEGFYRTRSMERLFLIM